MKKIIINADDYGLTKGVSRGIITLFKAGKISTCSVMANCEEPDWHFNMLKKSGMQAGVHLNLSAGRPISPPESVSTLIDRNGMFISAEKLIIRERTGSIDHGHIRRELKAQVNKMREYQEPDHFDGHRHFYFFSENMLKTVFSLMSELGFTRTRIPYEGRLYKDSGLYYIIRTAILNYYTEKAFKMALKMGFRFPKYFRGQQYTGNWNKKRFDNIFNNISADTEVMIHPGVCDKKLKRISSLNDCREKELKLFLNSEYHHDIILTSFKALLSCNDI